MDRCHHECGTAEVETDGLVNRALREAARRWQEVGPLGIVLHLTLEELAVFDRGYEVLCRLVPEFDRCVLNTAHGSIQTMSRSSLGIYMNLGNDGAGSGTLMSAVTSTTRVSIMLPLAVSRISLTEVSVLDVPSVD